MRVASALCMTVLVISLTAPAQNVDVQSVTRSFIDAYARADSEKVLQAVDERTIIYKSDATVPVRGTAAAKLMLANDARLWAGKASVGPMTDVSTSTEGNLHIIFFNALFNLGNRPPAPIRVCMVWRKSGAMWHLVQSSTSLVARGKSAKTMLKGNSP